jgi:hypothetical protein
MVLGVAPGLPAGAQGPVQHLLELGVLRLELRDLGLVGLVGPLRRMRPVIPGRRAGHRGAVPMLSRPASRVAA